MKIKLSDAANALGIALLRENRELGCIFPCDPLEFTIEHPLPFGIHEYTAWQEQRA